MNYKEFKKFILEEPVIFNHFSIVVSISFIINCLIFPAMFFQMYKTYKTKESQDLKTLLREVQYIFHFLKKQNTLDQCL